MANLAKLQFPPLEHGGINYVVWALEVQTHLQAQALQQTLKEDFDPRASGTVAQKAAQAVIMILRHLPYEIKRDYGDQLIFMGNVDLNQFFEQNEIDRVMSKTKAGTMMQKLLIAHFLFTSESSKLMGFDKVFVHVIDKYIRSGMAKEVYDAATIEKIKERGDILKPLLLGSQAPDLLMIDTIGHKQIAKMGFDTVKTSAGATKLYYDNAQNLAQTFVNLYGVKTDYLALVFWDVDCGHCKTEIPKLLEEYHALKKEGIDLKVVSVYTQHDYEKWRKYIIENKLDWINVYDGVHVNNIKEKYDIYSTPVIYVLNKDKRIKAKRIGTEQLKDIVKQMEKEYKSVKK